MVHGVNFMEDNARVNCLYEDKWQIICRTKKAWIKWGSFITVINGLCLRYEKMAQLIVRSSTL